MNFNSVSSDIEARILTLSDKEIENLTQDLLEMRAISDLED
ncbi:MAG: DUF4351 domain-containing protein [bacterium]|nr:MAG: DUF4351 domain-containing protein [bacterium]